MSDQMQLYAVTRGQSRMKIIHRALNLLFPILLLTACSPDVVYTSVQDLKFEDPLLQECVVSEAQRNGWS